jgi:GxxExxY protein
MEGRTKKIYAPIPAEVERIGKSVLDAAFKVHTVLGPGLLESVYENAMKHVIHKTGLLVETRVALPIFFEGVRLESGLQLDMRVEKA